jgi:hypothetical protein
MLSGDIPAAIFCAQFLSTGSSSPAANPQTFFPFFSIFLSPFGYSVAKEQLLVRQNYTKIIKKSQIGNGAT